MNFSMKNTIQDAIMKMKNGQHFSQVRYEALTLAKSQNATLKELIELEKAICISSHLFLKIAYQRLSNQPVEYFEYGEIQRSDEILEIEISIQSIKKRLIELEELSAHSVKIN